MRYIILALFLTGCVSTKDNRICKEYATVPQVVEQCTGGRGVAPQICIMTKVQKTFCAKYYEENL
jgi:hypothetical protein